MIKNFPPNTDPNLFSIIAVIAGIIATGDFDDYELNSIGNWVILFGQYILTFAAQAQLIEQRIEGHNININSRQYKNGGSPYTDNRKSNLNTRSDVEILIELVDKIQKELDALKKGSN